MIDALDGADAVLLDVDGVLCVGDEPTPGAAEAVAWLRARVPRVIVTTNDSRRSARAQRARLARAGAGGLPVVTAVEALAAELVRRGHRAVLPVGTRGFVATLARAGIEPDVARATAVAVGAAAPAAAIARARVAGLPVFAANADATVPSPEGPIPDTGAVLAALGAREPVVCGKPEAPFTALVEPLLDGARRVVVIGDGIATDLAWARARGWAMILVGAEHPDARASIDGLTALR